LQSKAIEIVALFIEKELFKKDKSIKKLNLKEEDIGKIKLAKTLIVKDIINPPSIEELSDLVGLNTFKLKVGFKQLYKTTIFGCLRNARMERAKEYLKEGRLTVIEIANNVGYSNPSHFAVAFRKKYGINPSKLQNRA
jgi:AraC-like DNA-binding protein